MTRFRGAVAMACTSSFSACALFHKQTLQTYYLPSSSTSHAHNELPCAGLQVQVSKQILRCPLPRSQQSHRPEKNLFSHSGHHTLAVCVHTSAYTKLNSEEVDKPLGFLRDDAFVDSTELPTSAYVHIPFCKRRCFYCDFAIVAVGDRNKANAAHIDSTMESYVSSLCKEITSTLERLPKVSPLKTLFFGGGTPSLLPVHHLSRIIEIFKCHCRLENDAEISMEMDPGTFDKLKMKEFLNCGVNRVSLGVQAFNDDFLKACGRSHGLQDVYEAIDIIHALGVRNWSVDLISSLPHQTLELWEESLCRAIDLAPAHVSVYDLQIEEGTKFGTWYKPGQHPLPDEDNSASFYRLASSLLREAGYEHYEISNYAKPGFQSRHNMVYWQNRPYFGFGLGATSYVNGKRVSRSRKWKEYADFAELCSQQKLDGLVITKSSMHDDAVEHVIDRLSDTIMLSLRLAYGLHLRHLREEFGNEWCVRICQSFVPFISSGHAIALDVNLRPVPPDEFSNRFLDDGLAPDVHHSILSIRLADPEGFLLSNEIISSVFSALSSK